MTSPPNNPPRQMPPASLGRRLLPAVVLTGVGVGLLANLDRAGGALAVSSLSTTGTEPAAGTDPTTATTLPASTTGTTAAAAAGATATARTVPATPAACSGTPVTGPVASTRWGNVQVAATLTAGGVVCDVQAVQAPTGERRSDSINAAALPVLHDRAVAAGGTGFQAVSGATVTSEGYRASLQAILDAA